MNRRIFLLGAGSALSCARDARPRLNVYNWSSYIDPATIARFEQERGARVRYGTYESNEEMLAKIVSGNSGWDVVFPTHSRLNLMQRNGLLQGLDHARLQGLGNLEERFRSPVWDTQLRMGVPYMWNATGIAWNRSIGAAPESWSTLWDATLSGRMTMLDDPEDAIGACLLRLGLSFDSVDDRELERAKAELIRQKRLLRAYISAEVRDQLVAGDVLAAQLWSTTTAQAVHSAPRNTELAFSYPKEGFPLYCDCAAILRESTHRELAHDFLSFLLRADVAAANARVADTATTNAAAQRVLPRDSMLYPPADVCARAHWPRSLRSADQRKRDRIWTEVKAS